MYINVVEIKIDKDSYPLTKNNYYPKVYKKKQIVIGHTFTDDMTHYIGWQNRYNGKNKKTAAFTIDVDGKIYQHFDPKYYSKFLDINNVDEHIISVVLVNKGWLIRKIDTDQYYDYLFKPVENIEIVNKKWRDHTYWATYSDKQIESLTELCRYLSKKFGIELQTIGHYAKFSDAFTYHGILSRSNYVKEFTDLSPSFDFTKFKNNLEKNE